MNVTLAVLCDFASVTQEGKLNILGVFGEINPPFLPFVMPQMFLVSSLTASAAEQRQKHLRVVLLGADGVEIFKAEQDVQLPVPLRPGLPINVNAIFGIAGLTFQQPGDYAFSIQIGGEEKASVPLHVNSPK
jgi:hypothetical protein